LEIFISLISFLGFEKDGCLDRVENVAVADTKDIAGSKTRGDEVSEGASDMA
jgi:hypothetical protein